MKNSEQVTFENVKAFFTYFVVVLTIFIQRRFHRVYSQKLIFYLKIIIFPNTKNLIKVN